MKITSVFSPNNFVVLTHVEVTDPYWVNFLYIEWGSGQLYSFACGYPVVLAPFVEEIILSHLSGLDALVENHLAMYVRVHFWTFSSIILILMSVLIPVPHCFHYCSFVVTFKIGSMSSPILFFFFNIILAIWIGPSANPWIWRLPFPFLRKKAFGILQRLHCICGLRWRVLSS